MKIKQNIKRVIFWLAILALGWAFMVNHTYASNAPKYNEDFASDLKKHYWVLNPESRFGVDKNKTLRENIRQLFYPNGDESWNAIYHVVRDMTLWIMIIYLVRAGASILFNRKPEDVKKTLWSLIYILIWWLFVYWANRIFGDVLNFKIWDTFTTGKWIEWFDDAAHKVFFVVLSALKAFAFFLAIIMIVITWFRVIAAWEWEKWKKLVKWLINVVVALLIIKWIDFIYYIAADTWSFVKNAADLIINIAKIFAYIYWVIIVIMVIVAWYLYITDGWSWSNFKKASNVLVNILLSALVLFAFLLITYQIFAEFQEWWDAVTDTEAFIMSVRNIA